MKKLITITVICFIVMMLSALNVFGYDFEENFSAASEKIGRAIATSTTDEYNLWSVTNYEKAFAEGTTATIEKDPKDEENIVLKLNRNTTGTASSNINYEVSHQITTYSEGIINYKVRFMTTNSSFRFRVYPIAKEIWNNKIVLADGSTITLTNDEKMLFKANEWHSALFKLDIAKKMVVCYIDGNIIGGTQSLTTVPNLNNIVLRMDRAGYTGQVYFDDITVEKEEEPEYITFDDIANGQKLSSVVDSLNFIKEKNDCEFSYTSSNEKIISNEGNVTQKILDSNLVTISVQVKNKQTQEKITEKKFEVVVPGCGEDHFTESFDMPQTANNTPLATTPTEGWNNWLLPDDNYDAATIQGNSIKLVEKNMNDKMLELVRTKKYLVSDKSVVHFRPHKNIEKMSDGLYTISFSFKPTSTPFVISIDPIGSIHSNAFYKGISPEIVMNYTTEEKALFKINSFNRATFVIDFAESNMMFYINGVCIEESLSLTFTELSDIGLYIKREGTPCTIYVDDLSIKRLNPSEREIVEIAYDFVDIDTTKSPLFLPTQGIFGTTVTWESLNKDVITDAGVITPQIGMDKTVIMRAVIRKNHASITKDFSVFVPKQNYSEYLSSKFDFDKIANGQNIKLVKENLSMDTEYVVNNKKIEVSWESSDTNIIELDGRVIRPDYNTFVTLTATISAIGENEESATKQFEVFVAGRGSILFFDDFECAELGQAISVSATEGYNGWRLDTNNFVNAEKENTRATIEKDPLNAENKVLQTYRENAGADNKININLRPGQKIDFKGAGLLSYSFDVKFESDATGFMVYPFVSWMTPSSVKLRDNTQIAFGKNTNDNMWHNIEIRYEYYKKDFELYIDSIKVGEHTFLQTPGGIETWCFSMQRTTTGSVLVDNCVVNLLEIGDEAAVKEVADGLSLPELIYDDVTLKTVGYLNTSIEWSSQNEAIVVQAVRGIVLRKDNNTEGTLTAVVKRGNSKMSKVISITVAGISATERELLTLNDNFILNGQEKTYVESNLNMPPTYQTSLGTATISYVCDNDAVRSDGTIVRETEDKLVNITANISVPGQETIIKKFSIIVAALSTTYSYEDFKGATEENASVENLGGWSISVTTGDDSVKNTVVADPVYGGDFANADKMLLIDRFVTATTGNPSIQSATLDLGKFNGEKKSVDFDFMFLDDSSKLFIKMEGINKIFTLSSQGIKRNGFNDSECNFENEILPYERHRTSIVMDSVKNEVDFYFDYKKINNLPIAIEGVGSVKALTFYSDKEENHEDKMLIDNIRTRVFTPSDEECVEKTFNSLSIGKINYATMTLSLPCVGDENTSLIWSSSNENIISANGLVTRGNDDERVTLTAAIRKENITRTKKFDVIVKGRVALLAPTEELMNLISNEITADLIGIENGVFITSDLNLFNEYNRGIASEIGGVNIFWESDYPNVIDKDGKIQQQRYDACVTLKATIISKEDSSFAFTKIFDAIIAMDSKVIREYTFNNIPQNMLEENVNTWTDIINKTPKVGEEYGISQFVDYVPEDMDKSFENANKALYIHRYFISSMGTTQADLYTAVQPSVLEEFSDSLAISFRANIRSEGRLKILLAGVTSTPLYLSKTSFAVNREPIFAIEQKDWQLVTLFLDNKSKSMDIYINNKKMNADPIVFNTMSGTINSIRFYNDDTLGTIIIDNIVIRQIFDNEKKRVEADYDALAIPSAISENIILPVSGKNGSRIIWNSSDENVITNSGKVNLGQNSKSVVLKALIICGENRMEKCFTVNVMPDQTSAYIVKDISVNGNTITTNVKNTGDKNAQVILMIYDKSELKEVKTLTSYPNATDVSLIAECNLSEISYGEIRASITVDGKRSGNSYNKKFSNIAK